MLIVSSCKNLLQENNEGENGLDQTNDLDTALTTNRTWSSESSG